MHMHDHALADRRAPWTPAEQGAQRPEATTTAARPPRPAREVSPCVTGGRRPAGRVSATGVGDGGGRTDCRPIGTVPPVVYVPMLSNLSCWLLLIGYARDGGKGKGREEENAFIGGGARLANNCTSPQNERATL